VSGNTLYGTTTGGGTAFSGTIFRVNTDGSGYTNLYAFSSVSTSISGTNGDGASPRGNLVLSGNALYGTTFDGGLAGNGTVFKVNTDGSAFAPLYTFNGLGDGGGPSAGLVQSGNFLYGTTYYGASDGDGGVFRVNTNGSGFTNIYSFSPQSADLAATNADGAYPFGGLVLLGNALYGTTSAGGLGGGGTVFSINLANNSFTNLHSFSPLSDVGTNSDGSMPMAGLAVAGNALYGTTSGGGTFGGGAVFALGTNGGGFVTLHSFKSAVDGAEPNAPLQISGSNLYGTTTAGGSGGSGTVFELAASGMGFTTLYNFTPRSLLVLGTNADGAISAGSLALAGNTLFGTTSEGGALGEGTAFALSLSPALAIRYLTNGVVLSWGDPTYSLQSAPSLGGTYSTISGAVSPHTNGVSGAAQFYRLLGN
jgi:uncharacterized repeat protein (TIGR03803 family)